MDLKDEEVKLDQARFFIVHEEVKFYQRNLTNMYVTPLYLKCVTSQWSHMSQHHQRDPINLFNYRFVCKKSSPTLTLRKHEHFVILATPYILNHLVMSSTQVDERILFLFIFCTFHPIPSSLFWQSLIMHILNFCICMHSLCMVSIFIG